GLAGAVARRAARTVPLGGVAGHGLPAGDPGERGPRVAGRGARPDQGRRRVAYRRRGARPRVRTRAAQRVARGPRGRTEAGSGGRVVAAGDVGVGPVVEVTRWE